MKRLLALTVLLLTLALLPVWFGPEWGVRINDFFAQEIPFVFETYRMLRSGSLPLWSWNTLLGDSFLGSYCYYTITSPFVWLQCLLPVEWLLASFWVVLYLKVMSAAAVTRLYLRQMGISSLMADVGALMYAFSSFFIMNLSFWFFAEPAIMFPLLLLALERYLARPGPRRLAGVAFATFGVAVINFFFSVGSLVIGFMYMVARLWGRRGGLKLLGLSTGGALLGVLLASPLLVIAYGYFSSLERASVMQLDFQFSYIYEAFKRLVSLLYPRPVEGCGEDFNTLGFNSVTLWLPFAGVPAALAYVWRKRDSLSVLILLLLIIYCVIPLCGVFILFRNPYYCRWGYALILLIILAATRYLDSARLSRRFIRNYGLVAVGVIALALILLVLRPQGYIPWRSKITAISYIEIGVALINLLLLYEWVRRGDGRRFLLICTCVMAALTAGITFAINFHYEFFSGLRLFDAPDQWVYRVDPQRYFGSGRLIPMRSRLANYTAIDNYAQLRGEPSINGYTSSNTPGLAHFYKSVTIGVALFDPVFPRLHPASTMPLLSVSRVVSDLPLDSVDGVGSFLRVLPPRNGERVYTHRRCLPMGFAYDSYMPADSVRELISRRETIDLPGMMLSHLAIESRDTLRVNKLLRRATPAAERFATPDGYASGIDVDSVVGSRARNVAIDFVGDTRGWSCRTRFDSPQVLFFSVVHDSGFSYYIDGEEVDAIDANLGMTALIVPAGEHSIRAAYMPPGLLPSLIVAGVTLLLLLLLLLKK